MKTRNILLDAVRGMAILIVVFAHALQVSGGETNRMLHDLIRQFQMPLLMAVSGFAAIFSVGKDNLSTSLAKKSKRLLLPYLCWAVIVFVGDLAMGGCSLRDVSRYVFCNDFWFLRILFEIAIVGMLCERLYGSRILTCIPVRIPRFGFVVLSGFCCTYLLSMLPGQRSVFHMSIWYALGFAIAVSHQKLPYMVKLSACVAGAVGYVVLNMGEPITAVRFARTCCGCLVVVLGCLSVSRWAVVTGGLSRIGMNTLPIYAIHWCLCFNPRCFAWAKLCRNSGEGVANAIFVALLWLAVVYSLIALFKQKRITRVLLMGEKK